MTPDGHAVFVFTPGTCSPLCSPPTTSVIDTTTKSIIAVIPVHGTAIAFSPTGDRAYIAGESISVIDTRSNTVTDSIELDGWWPIRVALSPDGMLGYVLLQSSAPGYPQKLSVFDTVSNSILRSFAGPKGDFALSPDGRIAYATGGGGVIALQTTDGAIKWSVALDAQHVAVNPNQELAYVATPGGLSILDTATGAVLSTHSFGEGEIPSAVAVTPDGTFVYAAAGAGVGILDTRTNSIVGSIGLAGAGARAGGGQS